MSWKTCKLNDICDKANGHIQTGPFGSQLHQSDYSDTGTPVVMPKDIINGKVSEDDIARVDDHHVLRLSRHKVDVGDILFSRRGDVGRCGYISKKEAGWLCGTGCLRVTVDAEIADSKFVFYYLQQPSSVEWIEKHAIGATMLNLNTGILASVPLLLPDLPTQHRIASILSAYDDLIENNRRQIKLLEEAAQRLYREWFVELRFPGHEDVKIVDGVPEGWKKQKLVDIIDVQYGFAFDSKSFNDKGNGVPIVRIRNIPDGTSSDFTTEKAEDKYIVHNGEIVVGMDGEFHINTWNGDDAYIVQRSCSMRPKDKYMTGWLLYAIYEPIKFYEKTVVGATVAHLGKKHIDSIYLLTSPHELYKPFVTINQKRQLLLNQIRRLADARDCLLPKLMSGEMEV
ncbi:MAG: restriction endonuclease subunit S [Aristaeellaceae bacterium]